MYSITLRTPDHFRSSLLSVTITTHGSEVGHGYQRNPKSFPNHG